MRAFVIADASKRKAKPVALLLWEPDTARPQGRFSLELSSGASEAKLPLSLSFCARREGRRATSDESETWVKSRIVPEDRHNIVEVLKANGLARYDEVALLAAGKGRSSDDDCLAFEVELADGLADALAGPTSKDAPSRADRFLDAIERQRAGSGPRYAVIDISEGRAHRRLAPEKGKAAKQIGGQIRARRKALGLTQKQLAARAGITQTVLSRVESGAGNPTLALLEDIAAALGETLDVSIGGRKSR